MASKKAQEPTGFQFDLLGDTWTVELRHGPMVEPDLGPVSGFCDSDRRLIVIEAKQDLEFMRKVFFHEVGHAAVSCFSTHGLPDKLGWIPEESAVECIGIALTHILRQAHMLPVWVLNNGNSRR